MHTHRIGVLVFLALSLALLSPATAGAQIKDTGAVVIRAIDPDGAPLAGVLVAAEGPLGTRTEYTGINGTTWLPGLAAAVMIAFDGALGADPFNWEAHYYRGRAFGVQGIFTDARDDFLAAARLGPGIGAVHEFAAIASADAGDYAAGWEHTIRAQQAGHDMNQRVETLRASSPPPTDLDERLAAPRLYVGRAVVPDPEAQAFVEAVSRAVRLAISESHDFGLVTDASRADRFLVLQINDIDRLGSVSGVLEIHEPGGDRVYEQGFSIDEVFNEDMTAAVFDGLLSDLAIWLERR